MKVAQLCPTMDYRVHEILQARILEWVSLANINLWIVNDYVMISKDPW